MPPASGPKRFVIIPAESHLSFFVKTGIGTIYGKTQKLEGFLEVAWDEDDKLVTSPTPRMHVEFAVESLTCGTAAKDPALWATIDCVKFPKIGAELLQIANPAAQVHIATGRISVGGIIRTYEGSLLLKRAPPRVIVDGFITINLADFNIKETRALPFGRNVDLKVRMIASARG